MSENKYLLRYGPTPTFLLSSHYRRCSIWSLCILTHASALLLKESRTFAVTTACSQSWLHTLVTCSCTVCTLLIGWAYTNVFKCPYSQKSKGFRTDEHEGHDNRLPRSIHRSWNFWVRYCCTICRKWGGALSCINHIHCLCSMVMSSNTQVILCTEICDTQHLLICLVKCTVLWVCH